MSSAADYFTIGAYLAFVSCCIACYREGLIQKSSRVAFIQFALLSMFIGLCWLLESWANYRAPFYEYPEGIFNRMIPMLDREVLPEWLAKFFEFSRDDNCETEVSGQMPACIPIAGGCIIFCLMWTGRQLLGRGEWYESNRKAITVPALVGLGALVMDASIDPVLATSKSCPPPKELLYAGHDFWIWYTHPGLADIWYDIPLFNFSFWFLGPALFVSLALIANWVMRKITLGCSMADFPTGAIHMTVGAVILIAYLVTPSNAHVPALQYTVVALSIGISVVFVALRWKTFKRDNSPVRWELIAPLAFFYLLPLSCLLVTDRFQPKSEHLLLIATAFITSALGVFLAFSPYHRFGGHKTTRRDAT